jgi:hypothetical protein
MMESSNTEARLPLWLARHQDDDDGEVGASCRDWE